MSGKEISNPLLKGCLNPRAGKNVNMRNVFIGCKVGKYKSRAQTNTDVDGDPKDRRHDSHKDELQHKIECALKHRYSEITMPTLPWLEMIDIPIEKYTTLQLELENEEHISKIIHLKNLFENISSTPADDNSNPHKYKKNTRNRILIESQPGYGKTTLAHKIASDWSRGIKYVKRFKFAILIILREFSASSLKQELKDVISVENYDDGDFWSVINTDETLLIFGGLDEISGRGRLRQDIQEILYDDNEYKMTIVTTCRVGLSDLNRRDIRSTYRGLSLKTDIWGKKITILGINERNQSEFIEKFVDENYKRILIPRLLNIIDTRKKMFNSPLLLMLLVYVTSENHDVKIDTDTDLYKALVDCIIRRSVDKINPEISCVDFTLFASRDNVPIFDDCKKKFFSFGEICLDRIVTGDLQFGSDIKYEAIHQLGFLIKHIAKKCFGPIVWYEGFHLSILEFAAAVYMAHYFATNDNKFRPADIDKLFEIVYNKGMASMVLPFLCDLLGNGIAQLTEELSRYYAFFWFNKNIVEFLFSKCLVNNVGKEHFVKIIPPYIEAFRLSVLSNFVTTEYLAKLLVITPDKVRYLRKICGPIRLRGLVCNEIDDDFVGLKGVLDHARNITCQSLSFTMNEGVHYENMINCCKIFCRISSDCKNLYFCRPYRYKDVWRPHGQKLMPHSKISDDFYTFHRCASNTPPTPLPCLPRLPYCSGPEISNLEICITSGILVGEKLNNVVIDLGFIEKEVIVKLMECNRIENLVLCDVFSSTNYLEATVNYLTTKTDCINSLFVVHCDLCLGWDDFTKGDEKWLKESVNAHTNLDDTSLIESNTLYYNVRAFSPLKPSRLCCDCHKLQSIRNWNNWDMIVELTLSDVTGSSPMNLPDFSKFKSLKILTLIIGHGSELNEYSVENILGSIKCLNLIRLKMMFYSSEYFHGSLIDGVRQLLQNKAFFCSESIRFEVIPIEVRPELFDFEIIKSALHSDSKIVFCIASNKWSDLRKIVMDRMNDLLVYNIKYSYTPYTIEYNPLKIEYQKPFYAKPKKVVYVGFYCNPDVQYLLELTLCK